MSGYYVEGWRKHECVAFAFVARAATVERRASHFILDKGADSVWVYRNWQAVAQWQATGGWKTVLDEDLAAAITDAENR